MVLTENRSAHVMNEALIICILPLSSCVQLFNWYLRNDRILFIWLFYTVFVLCSEQSPEACLIQMKHPLHLRNSLFYLPHFFISSLLNMNIVAMYKKCLSTAVMFRCPFTVVFQFIEQEKKNLRKLPCSWLCVIRANVPNCSMTSSIDIYIFSQWHTTNDSFCCLKCLIPEQQFYSVNP